MTELLINGGDIHKVPTTVRGMSTVMVFCSCCGRRVAEEMWVDSSQSPTCTMSLPVNYVRVLFGTDPRIFSSCAESVPAIFTPVYFCKECEDGYHIIYSLLKV